MKIRNLFASKHKEKTTHSCLTQSLNIVLPIGIFSCIGLKKLQVAYSRQQQFSNCVQATHSSVPGKTNTVKGLTVDSRSEGDYGRCLI